MSITIPPGVFDILPNSTQEPWRNSHIWNYVESMARQTAREFGFQEIRTPAFERTELFTRGVGETSDIVTKEMYTFKDKGDRSMTLRPEGTAGVIRAFIDNQLHTQAPTHKLFYIGPMFRYERQQAGRYRQHHQFGVEVIGVPSPEQDAETIDLLYTLYTRLGLKNLQVYLNSLGDPQSRIAYRKALQEYLKASYERLSAESKVRFETNPLRILDSKDPEDRKIIAEAPSILDFLSDDSRAHFERVKALLTQLNIPYIVNAQLVRGLDYYNHTVFEITSGDLGAQNSVGGGGRYDGLVKLLGGPDLPGLGFGTGIERIIQTMLKQNVAIPERYRPMLYLIPLGDQAKDACFQILHDLRMQGISAEMEYTGKKLNKVMQYANTIGAKYVAVIGDEELKAKEVELKEMETGTKTKIPFSSLARILQIDSMENNYLKMWETLSQPFETKEETQFFVERLNKTISDTQLLTQKLQGAVTEIKGLLSQ